MKLSRILVTALAAAVTFSPTLSAQQKSLAAQSQNKARAILDRALEAHGGLEKMRDVKAVELRAQGSLGGRLQQATPEPPHQSGSINESITYDLAKNRLAAVQETDNGGFRGDTRIVLNGTEGTAFNRAAKTYFKNPNGNRSMQFTGFYRRLPLFVLLAADQQQLTLRYLGTEAVEGKPHEVVTFVHPDGNQLGLYFDQKTGLLTKYEIMFQDALAGDTASEIFYREYADVGGIKLPAIFEQRQVGDVIVKSRLQPTLNPAVEDATFAATTDGFTQTTFPPAQPQNTEKLAKGVHNYQNYIPGYNVLAVEFQDYLFVVEAPGTSQQSSEMIARLKKDFPNKPIRYVAVTHFHGDHMGGLRPYIAEGATVVTTPGNKKVIEKLAAAPLKDALAKNPKPVKFEFVENGKRAFSDGTQTLEFHDVGPTPHIKEILAAYVPKERILYTGDMVFAPFDTTPLGPVQGTEAAFQKNLAKLGLKVDTLANVHGKTQTMSDYQAALPGRNGTSHANAGN